MSGSRPGAIEWVDDGDAWGPAEDAPVHGWHLPPRDEPRRIETRPTAPEVVASRVLGARYGAAAPPAGPLDQRAIAPDIPPAPEASRPRPRRPATALLALAAFLLGCVLVGVLAVVGFGFDGSDEAGEATEGQVESAELASSGTDVVTDVDAGEPAAPGAATGDQGNPAGIPDPADLPEGEEADRMAIRIETAAEGDGGATATVREDGRVHFEGAFRSQPEADRYVARARSVFGAEAVVERYVIDPDAPAPTAGDVALDKPVLFESGSAEIHPEYLPFLAACGDVLKLNPEITMSISAFTDSVGDETFNLDLSRQRAQAIVDFYADYQVDRAQLIGSGFGEEAAFGDNGTDAGRAQNRRAMLQLLNVMGDE